MKIFTIKEIALTGLLLGLAQNSALGFSLDLFTDFEGSNTFQSISLPAFANSGAQVSDVDSSLDSTVFGASRTLRLTRLNGTATPNQANLSAFNGIASLSTPPDYANTAEIIWDGFDASNSGQNIQLDGSTVQDSFKVDITLLNIGTGDGDLSLNFQIKDTSGNSATITQTFTSNINNTTSVYFPYSSRVENPSNTSNVSLTNIDYIGFYTSDENIGDDFTFDLVQTAQEVPFEFSPGLGIILGGSFFGLKSLRKKLKANN